MLNKHSGFLYHAEMWDEDERTIFDGRIVNASMNELKMVNHAEEGGWPISASCLL
jgi:hypothetical protein